MSCVFKFTTNTLGLLVQMIAHKILIKIGVAYVLWESGNTVETVVLLSHKSPDSVINAKAEFGEDDDKVPLNAIAERAKKYQP